MSKHSRLPAAVAAAALALTVAGGAAPALAAPAPTTGPVAVPAAAAATAPASARTTSRSTAPSAPAARPTLRPGAKGAAVVTLQKRLAALGYWGGVADGHYGHLTSQAVMALQKTAGLGRDGITGPATWRALDQGIVPKPRSNKGRVLEVDLTRQVMFFVVDGKTRYILNTSTGTAKTPTPTGQFRIFRQEDGWRKAPLGLLYRPKYFHRGYAVHGVKDGGIPGYPASHGCTRVSTPAMDMMWGKNGLRYRDIVWVY